MLETPRFISSEIYRRSRYGTGHPLAIPRVSTVIDLARALGWLPDGQYIDSPVATPDELVPLLRKGRSVQPFEPPDLEVWDGTQWTRVLAVTATRRRSTDEDHRMLSIEARAGIVEATASGADVALELDGEPLGALPARFELLPAALSVIGPAP